MSNYDQNAAAPGTLADRTVAIDAGLQYRTKMPE